MTSDKKYTQQEIRDAIDYLRGERDMPSTEIELARRELEREGNFAGCMFLIFGFIFVGCVAALATGHMAGGLILLFVSAGIGYLVWKAREDMKEKARKIEELKTEKANTSDAS
jgi:hypothetical protein